MADGRTGRWAAILVVTAAALAGCGGGSGVDADACEGSEQLRAETLVPDGPYRARPLPEEGAAEIEKGFEIEGARTDLVQVVDSRDKATFVLAASTSLGEEVRAVDVFAGFADGAGTPVQETEMGTRPARLARVEGSTRIVTTKGCSAVTLIGIDERPTRALAAALEL